MVRFRLPFSDDFIKSTSSFADVHFTVNGVVFPEWIEAVSILFEAFKPWFTQLKPLSVPQTRPAYIRDPNPFGFIISLSPFLLVRLTSGPINQFIETGVGPVVPCKSSGL